MKRTIYRLVSGSEDTGVSITVDGDMVDIHCTDGGLDTHSESMTLKRFKAELGLKDKNKTDSEKPESAPEPNAEVSE